MAMSVMSICQNLQPFTGNGDVSILVKNSRVGRKLQNKETNKQTNITREFQVILSKNFRGVAIANCFSSVANFSRVPRMKRGIIPRKKRIKKSSKYAYISSLSFIPKNLNKIL